MPPKRKTRQRRQRRSASTVQSPLISKHKRKSPTKKKRRQPSFVAQSFHLATVQYIPKEIQSPINIATAEWGLSTILMRGRDIYNETIIFAQKYKWITVVILALILTGMIIHIKNSGTSYESTKKKDIAHSFEIGNFADNDNLEAYTDGQTSHELEYRLLSFMNMASTDSNVFRIVETYDFVQLYSSIRNRNEFQPNRPTIVWSGFSNHSTCILVNNNKIYYVNKGEGKKSSFITVYEFNPTKMNQAVIDKFKKNLTLTTSEQYQQSRDNVLKSIGATKSDNLTQSITKYYEQRDKQIVGNCAWESKETLVYAYMFDQTTTSQSSQASDTHFKTVYDDFDYFQRFISLTQLKEYIAFYYDGKLCHKDSRLSQIAQCFVRPVGPPDDKLIERALHIAYAENSKRPVHNELLNEIIAQLPDGPMKSNIDKVRLMANVGIHLQDTVELRNPAKTHKTGNFAFDNIVKGIRNFLAT